MDARRLYRKSVKQKRDNGSFFCYSVDTFRTLVSLLVKVDPACEGNSFNSSYEYENA